MQETILDVPLFNQPRGKAHCALVCMRMLMAYHGKEYSHEELLEKFPDIDKIRVGITPATALFMVQDGFKVTYCTHSSLINEPSLKDKTENNLDLFKEKRDSLPTDSSARKQWDKIIEFIKAGGKFSTKLLTTDDIDNLIKENIPVRVGIKSSILHDDPTILENHGVVIRGVRSGDYFLNDPAPRFKEPYWINKDKLLKSWRANGSSTTYICN